MAHALYPCHFSGSIEYAALILFPALFIIAIRYRALNLPAALVLFCTLGLSLTTASLTGPEYSGHIRYAITEKTKLSIAGRLIKMVEFDGERSRLLLDVEAILPEQNAEEAARGKNFLAVRGKLQLSVFGNLQIKLNPGDHIMAMATLSPVHSFQTPGAFDYRLYLQEKGIYVSGWIKSERHILKVKQKKRSWYKFSVFFEKIRQHTSCFLDKTLDPENAALYKALLIGYRGAIPASTLEQYKACGVMHLLANKCTNDH